MIANFETLFNTSKYAETLNVSEHRQFRNRGLSHIEDCVYEFFIEVEVLHVSCLNDNKLALFGEELISQTESLRKNDQQLLQKWLACFPQEEEERKLVRF